MRNFRETAVKTVLVDVQELQGTLAANLETHKKEFREAWLGYEDARKHAIAKIAEVATDCDHTIEGRKKIHDAYAALSRLDKPQDHSKDYEQAIKVMRWERRKEIELSINDFECYVEDNWGWTGSFKMSHSNYSSS